MPRVEFITRDGDRLTLEAPPGCSLMALAVTSGIDGIEGECGGSLACGTCHVHIRSCDLFLPEMSVLESEMLEFAAGERRPESRLACQIIVTEDHEGLVVAIPCA